MDFNIGIILRPNDFSHYINMTDVEDYVFFAALEGSMWGENPTKWEVTWLELVPCSSNMFNEPYGPIRDIYLEAIPYMTCIKNYKDLTL